MLFLIAKHVILLEIPVLHVKLGIYYRLIKAIVLMEVVRLALVFHEKIIAFIPKYKTAFGVGKLLSFAKSATIIII